MRARIGGGRMVGMACLAALMASPSGRAEAGRVRGTVVDREGKPAGGARVWVAKLGFLEADKTIEATADASGAFGVEAGPGNWAVFALKGNEGGRITWDSIPEVEEGKDPAPVTVRLGKPSNLKGRLLDAETGVPIANGRFALDDARRIEVDALGRFEAPGLEMTHHEAYPLCPGFERRRILFDTTGRPDAELELKLPRAGKVVGRVLDGEGKPIAGATVGLRTSGSIFSGSALWERCSADGRFTYEGKALGRSGRLSARAPGYQDQEREDVVALDASTPVEVDFQLLPDPRKGPLAKVAAKAQSRRTVSGKVIGPEGKPVDAAVVRWGLLVSSDSVPETKSDAKGEFRLEGLPDEANILSVMAKKLTPSFPAVEAGGDRRVDVELKAGATIRGRVLDDVNAPIEGVRVIPQVNSPQPNRGGGFVSLNELEATTDRQGRFTLEGMPEGVLCTLLDEGHSAVRQRALSYSDESKNEMVMLGEGVIRGRVVGPLGDPVRNFRVQVGIPKGNKPGDPVGGYFAGYAGTGLAFTRDDGEFTVSGLVAGNLHRLTVVAENLGSGEVDRVEAKSLARLKPGDDATIKLSAGHPLRVRVFQKEGKPVEGARVTVIQNEGRGVFQWGIGESSWDDSVVAKVNDQGWAEFPSLAFGKGTVIVRAKGFARTKLDWVKDEEEFNAFLEPEAKLNGTVLDEDGKPVAGARLLLRWGQAEMTNVPIGEADGRFQVDGMGSGKYTLSVMTGRPGQVAPSASVELESGKTTSQDLRVQKPAPGAAAKKAR